MISPRSKPARAGFASALTLLALCAAMLVLPAAGTAAPTEGEQSSPEGPPLPQLAFEPGSYDFGLRQANSNAAQAYLQLRNNGAAVAPVYSLEIVGSGSNSFWIGQSDCYGATLNPNETCSVQVNFNPNDATTYEAQLRAGSGVTKAIEVTNSGNYPGGAFIAVIAGGAVGSFHLLDENCTGIPLSPEASCTLLVNFRPLSTGVKTARLGLFGDSDGGSQITLTGIGTGAESSAEAPKSTGANAATLSQPADKRRPKHRKHRARSAGRTGVSARWASR